MRRHPSLLNKIPIMLLVMVISFTACVTPKPAFHNTVIDPPVAAAEIKMTDHNGKTFQLSNERGKVLLLYFGFVNCPDECPLTMAHIKQALDALGSQAQKVEVVMVSTDPVRDTPQALGNFLGAFNPTFIGIPGSPEELAKIYKDYGVTVLDGGETHSSYTYVIDQKGNLRLTFNPDTQPDDIAADLKNLLAQE
jgi:protein SCO1/2